MAVVVHRIAVVVDEIVAVNVVDEAVAVVVVAVAGDFVGVRPDIRRQVAMGVIDAGVEHGHHDLGASGADVPGIGRVDRAHAPKLAILRIVGNRT